MYINKNDIWLVLLSTMLFVSCSKDDSVEVDTKYTFIVPDNFPDPTYTFDNNHVTEAGFILGRRIFFDPILSRDSSISCATCHVQAVAFADPQHRRSIGIDDLVGTRNAPPIFNLAFMNTFFWDGGVIHVDFIPPNAIENPVEMDEVFGNVILKLANHPDYPALFGNAFETDSVSSPRILHALSQFMNMMVSANSRYDKYVRNEGEVLSSEELAGMAIFESKCSSCHGGQLFTDQSFRNNGLDSIFTDLGRAVISEKDEDQGKFRVPTLRNVELTSPYMHDGRINTLEEVLDHYSDGVTESHSLDPELKGDNEFGIQLSEDEKQKIVVFLKTLTDREFTQDERFRIN